MHVDFLTLAALRDALDAFQDARIQKVVQTDERAYAFELYAGRRETLVLDVHPASARAWLQQEGARRGVDPPTPLALLLRRYTKGARLRRVVQPPWERILRFEIEGREGAVTLVAEIMGRHSNLLLLDADGVIRECVVRAGATQNRYRETLPNHPYVPPPPLDLPSPLDLSADAWRARLAAAPTGQTLKRWLPRAVAGVSPTAAREIGARAAGNPNATVEQVTGERLVEAAAALFAPLTGGAWEPHVALDEEGTVVAFAPYALTQFPRHEPAASISEALQAYFAARLTADRYAAARRAVAARLKQAQTRTARRLSELERQHMGAAGIERLREAGELLLAYQWQVTEGAAQVTVPDFEGAPRQIRLDPDLSPVENANDYFLRYEKKKRAAAALPPRIETARNDLAFLESLSHDLRRAESRPEIEAVEEEMVTAGLLPPRGRPKGGGSQTSGPHRLLVEDWTVLVGRNARQNDEVTFRLAGSQDLWLHARGVPGSHVIIRRGSTPPTEEVIARAAALAAYHSASRTERVVPVDVTERRHVRRIAGARPGLVTYRNERTLTVEPRGAEEEGGD